MKIFFNPEVTDGSISIKINDSSRTRTLLISPTDEITRDFARGWILITDSPIILVKGN